MRLKYKISLAIIVLLMVGCFMTYQSYALYVANLSGNDNNLNVGCFAIEFSESSTSISLDNTYPISDTKGLTIAPYTFTITNKCTTAASYSVILSSLTTNGIDDSNIKYAIYETTKPTSGTLLTSATSYTDTSNLANVKNRKNSYQVATGGLKGATEENGTGGSKTYNLILWLDEATGNEAMSKTFSASVNVVSAGGEYTPTAVEKITELAQTDTTNLATDDYGNTRYIGADPNNYVSIDGDIWRIIGTMKSVDDGTGNKEDRVKLIRSEAIGEYSWDTSDSSVNDGSGVNEWSQADLMKLLNPGYESETVGGSLYWNSGAGKCYSDYGNSTTSCNFTSTGIKDKLKTLISDAVWNTGANDGKTYTYENIITSKSYELERSSNTGKICSSGNYCNDTVERTTTWTGKVGLMYPSDYGYATSGGSTTDRATCLNKELFNWDSSSVSDCKNNDWLFNSNYQWTISPYASSSHAYNAFTVTSGGNVAGTIASNGFGVRPVVYLTSNVGVQSGDGSSGNPFILG